MGSEAKPQEAGGNFFNDEKPVSLPCLSLLCPCLACCQEQSLDEIVISQS